MLWTSCWNALLEICSFFCCANNLRVQSLRGFTVLNMHASKGAFPFLGCKGADTIVILKWLVFLARLYLADDGWSSQDQQVLTWIRDGAVAGLSFSQGIHGHGIWLKGSCAWFLRKDVQTFGSCYSHLAFHCLNQDFNLFGMVPKLHAMMHYRTDFDISVREHRELVMNPAVFDNSNSEDFIGQIARQSRRISFRNIERTLLDSYKTKAHFQIQRYRKRRRVT